MRDEKTMTEALFNYDWQTFIKRDIGIIIRVYIFKTHADAQEAR
jgi:hypothetical protein